MARQPQRSTELKKIIMQTKILKVVAQGEPAYVPEKAAVKREQSQACLGYAEREQARRDNVKDTAEIVIR